MIPFSYLFRRVLDSDEDIVGHDIRYQRSILNTSIFTIEPHSVICGIFQDITEPIFQKEQIIGRAREVIQKNLKTVQQIAYLLGENAADSEIILNSIVRSFSPEEIDDRRREEAAVTQRRELHRGRLLPAGQAWPVDLRRCVSLGEGEAGRAHCFRAFRRPGQRRQGQRAGHDDGNDGAEVHGQRDGYSPIGGDHHGHAADLQRAQDELFDLYHYRYGRTGETRIIEHGNPPFLLIRPDGEAEAWRRPKCGRSAGKNA